MASPVVFFDLGNTLVDADQHAWLPGAQALLAQLRQAGMRLGIISNTSDLVDRAAILALLPPDFDLALFDPELVVFSSEVGCEKPQREIFDKAVDKSKRLPRSCLYVGENIIETLMAQEAGMRAIRVQVRPNSDLAGLAQAIEKFLALR